MSATIVGQTPEQRYEIIRKVYELIGREYPDETKTTLVSSTINIDLSDSKGLIVTVGETLRPVQQIDAERSVVDG